MPAGTRRKTDTHSGAPLYQRLAAILRAEIESGSLGPNATLPSERDLAAQHAMSRDTVRKAVRLLEEQGLLFSDQGRGTFVAPSAVREMSQFLDSFSRDTRQRGGAPGQKILLVEATPATIAVATVLNVAPRQTVTRIKRIRTIDGEAIGIHDAYVALPPGAVLDQGDLERSGSLGSIAASAEDAAGLNVLPGSPLLLCERITLSERRIPIEYCVMKYVSSYRYTARIKRSNPLAS